MTEYRGSARRMFSNGLQDLREKLLLVKGIGQETADSILLYAGNKPSFVVDAYTRRVFSRHRLIKEDEPYEDIRALFMKNIRPNAGRVRTRKFNEYHALIVELGKRFCKKSMPLCPRWPLHLDF